LPEKREITFNNIVEKVLTNYPPKN